MYDLVFYTPRYIASSMKKHVKITKRGRGILYLNRTIKPWRRNVKQLYIFCVSLYSYKELSYSFAGNDCSFYGTDGGPPGFAIGRPVDRLHWLVGIRSQLFNVDINPVIPPQSEQASPNQYDIQRLPARGLKTANIDTLHQNAEKITTPFGATTTTSGADTSPALAQGYDLNPLPAGTG